jgi:hypothetical protein
MIGLLLVIPAPWAATGFYRWMVYCLRVPDRPNLAFTGRVGDIWYVFVLLGLLSYAGFSGVPYLEYIVIPVDALLSWMTVRWIAANLSSNGEPLPVEFKGSALGYVGWYLLMYISVITIIGWAWVITAWMRWNCRNVSGTRREIVFNATGWQMLWRTLLFGFGSALLLHCHGCCDGTPAGTFLSSRWLKERLTPTPEPIICVRGPSLPAPPKPPACRRA